MEHLGQVTREHLEWLVRTGGQVVHTHVFILTARGYHVSGNGERNKKRVKERKRQTEERKKERKKERRKKRARERIDLVEYR